MAFPMTVQPSLPGFEPFQFHKELFPGSPAAGYPATPNFKIGGLPQFPMTPGQTPRVMTPGAQKFKLTVELSPAHSAQQELFSAKSEKYLTRAQAENRPRRESGDLSMMRSPASAQSTHRFSQDFGYDVLRSPQSAQSTRRISKDFGHNAIHSQSARRISKDLEKPVTPPRSRRGSSGSCDDTKVEDVVLSSQVLGKGDFSTVYKGTWKGQDVAIKVLDPKMPQNRGRNVEADFKEELQALSALDHPNCLKLLTSAPMMIVTELARGLPLADLLYKERQALPNPSHFASLLAKVVAHLHTRTPAIVHRDIKPENVMVDPASGDLKLIDFGMAKVVVPSVRGRQATFDGSPLYGAPEAHYGSPPAPSSEVWSLACVMMEMYGLGRPFERHGVNGLQELRHKLQSGICPYFNFPSVRRPDLIKRAFSGTPANRPTAAELTKLDSQ